jgi:hypothetical protein
MSAKKAASASNLHVRSAKARARRASVRKKYSSTKFSTPYMNTLKTKGLIVPQADAVRPGPAASAETSAVSAPSLFSGLGGIEGIMSMMGKIQQMYRMFQQMGPLLKMINSFGGPRAATASLRAIRTGKTRRR